MCTTCDLVLIRHEEADGNVAFLRSKFQGDDSGFTPELRLMDSQLWSLTQKGKERLGGLSKWLRENLSLEDFVFVSSPSRRTLETSNLLFPEENWIVEELVKGRNWGGIESLPWSEWHEHCRSHGQATLPSGFHGVYPNGESMVEVSSRFEKFLSNFNQSAVVVSHGEVLQTARMLIEQIPQDQFEDLDSDGRHIRNGHVVWYSKRDPVTGHCAGTFIAKKEFFEEGETPWIALPAR